MLYFCVGIWELGTSGRIVTAGNDEIKIKNELLLFGDSEITKNN
jgi:hypothetical protein